MSCFLDVIREPGWLRTVHEDVNPRQSLLAPRQSFGAGLFRIPHQTVEAADPAAFVAGARGFVGNSLMGDDHFGRGAVRFKTHYDALCRSFLGFQFPGVGQPMRWFDGFEGSRDPNHLAVGKLVGNAVGTATRKSISAAGHATPFAPPVREQRGLRPAANSLSRGALIRRRTTSVAGSSVHHCRDHLLPRSGPVPRVSPSRSRGNLPASARLPATAPIEERIGARDRRWYATPAVRLPAPEDAWTPPRASSLWAWPILLPSPVRSPIASATPAASGQTGHEESHRGDPRWSAPGPGSQRHVPPLCLYMKPFGVILQALETSNKKGDRKSLRRQIITACALTVAAVALGPSPAIADANPEILSDEEAIASGTGFQGQAPAGATRR